MTSLVTKLTSRCRAIITLLGFFVEISVVVGLLRGITFAVGGISSGHQGGWGVFQTLEVGFMTNEKIMKFFKSEGCLPCPNRGYNVEKFSPSPLRTWRVILSLVRGVSMRASSSVVALMAYRNSETERTPCWLNVSDCFNCVTLIHDRLANRQARVLQASWDVSAIMATRGIIFRRRRKNRIEK